MNAVLLDTNIISFIFKKDSRAKSYESHLRDKILTTSFMNVAELYQWAEMRNWGEKRKMEMQKELRKYLVFPYNIETCRLWGKIRAQCSKMGQPISPQDAWIAATARQHKLPLVTHNPDHFEAVEELQIISAAS
jgi:predicted nucleic acid-binding protein